MLSRKLIGSLSAQAPDPGAGDPHYANVSLLLRGEGTNGSQSFTDLSPAPKTLTTFGNTQISTSVKKNGTGSIYFDGVGDYLSAPSSADFQFGTMDFTIESWLRLDAIGAYNTLLDVRHTDGQVPYGLFVDNTGKPYWYDAGGMYTSTLALSAATWGHVAVTRAAGIFRIFVNGAQGYSIAHSGALSASGSARVGMNLGNSAGFKGYLDDFRITKGVARYTSAFTPV